MEILPQHLLVKQIGAIQNQKHIIIQLRVVVAEVAVLVVKLLHALQVQKIMHNVKN